MHWAASDNYMALKDHYYHVSRCREEIVTKPVKIDGDLFVNMPPPCKGHNAPLCSSADGTCHVQEHSRTTTCMAWDCILTTGCRCNSKQYFFNQTMFEDLSYRTTIDKANGFGNLSYPSQTTVAFLLASPSAFT